MEAEEKEYGEGFVQIRGTIWRSSWTPNLYLFLLYDAIMDYVFSILL